MTLNRCYRLRLVMPSRPTPPTQVIAHDSSLRQEPYLTPAYPTTLGQAKLDLELPVEFLPARLSSKPLSSLPATDPPRPIQPTPPTNTSLPQCHLHTYVSVLRQHTPNSLQPKTNEFLIWTRWFCRLTPGLIRPTCSSSYCELQ
jgi:hypothetical protein